MREDPRQILGAEAVALRCRRRSDDAIEVLDVPEPLKGMRRAAPLLDPRVDRDAGP